MNSMYDKHVSWEKINKRLREGMAEVAEGFMEKAMKIVREAEAIKEQDIHKPEIGRRVYILLGRAQEINLLEEKFVKKVADYGFA